MIAALFVPFALATEAPPYPDAPDKPSGPLSYPADGFGLGIVLGLPTGISLGWRPGDVVNYDAAVAWSFDKGTLALHADALFTLSELQTDDIPDTKFPVWVGIGPRLRVGDEEVPTGESEVSLGVRVPFGMSAIHENLPLEAFLEVAPGVQAFPETVMTFDIAVGLRFYFGRRLKPIPTTGTVPA